MEEIYYDGGSFEFIKMPAALFKDEIYMFCLQITELSKKNGWKDKSGKTYIYYLIKKIMEKPNCSNKTAIKTIEELEEVGLLSKYRQRLGKPNMIYVKDFRV